MKKLIVPILLLSSTLSFAKNRTGDRNDHRNNNRNDPPSTVQQNFQRDNPNRNANWSQKNNDWHATYKDDNARDVNAYYDRRGRRTETRTTWSRNEVPRDLDNRIDRMYHTKNYNAVRIERPNSQPLFQILLNLGGGRNRTVYMDEKGRQKQYNDRY